MIGWDVARYLVDDWLECPSVFDEVLEDGKKYLVTFVEYGNQDECTPEQIKIKNKYGAKSALSLI